MSMFDGESSATQVAISFTCDVAVSSIMRCVVCQSSPAGSYFDGALRGGKLPGQAVNHVGVEADGHLPSCCSCLQSRIVS